MERTCWTGSTCGKALWVRVRVRVRITARGENLLDRLRVRVTARGENLLDRVNLW